jgi:hypothetical protein
MAKETQKRANLKPKLNGREDSSEMIYQLSLERFLQLKIGKKVDFEKMWGDAFLGSESLNLNVKK